MSLEHTQLKFAISAATGDPIGFVSRHSKTKQLRGVREDSRYKKKICVLSQVLQGKVVPNVLYSVELKPMHTGMGFVAVSAVPVLFPATVELEFNPGERLCRVLVNFGNKTVFFDPLGGKSHSSRNPGGVIGLLQARTDIADVEAVIRDFREQALELLRRMSEQGVLPAELPGL